MPQNPNEPELKPEEQHPAKSPAPSLPGPREMPDVEVDTDKTGTDSKRNRRG